MPLALNLGILYKKEASGENHERKTLQKRDRGKVENRCFYLPFEGAVAFLGHSGCRRASLVRKFVSTIPVSFRPSRAGARESRNPGKFKQTWFPAFAGMTRVSHLRASEFPRQHANFQAAQEMNSLSEARSVEA
jgi:hypothetical protein